MGIHPATVTLVLAFVGAGAGAFFYLHDPVVAGGIAGLGVLVALSFRVASQWQTAVVLRLGRFSKLRGPGFFAIVPILDTVAMWVDTRTMSTPFNAEQTLTRDSVPVDVDAVLFWRVVEPAKAVLEVASYKEAIFWAAQTALRDVMGKADISELLVGREHIDESLRDLIHERVGPWGINVLAVEIRDVKIPESLQDAMSMQAQAERERQARVILADSEVQIAKKFKESAVEYLDNPTALQLRAMNVLLEGMREGSTMVVVPSTAVETMGLGATMGMTSLARGAAGALAQASPTQVGAASGAAGGGGPQTGQGE